MKRAYIQSVLYQGIRRIKLVCDNDSHLDVFIRTIPGAEWNVAHKYWHVPYTDASISVIDRIRIEQHVEFRGYREFIEERKFRYFDRRIVGENGEALKKFVEYLTANRYSERTVRLYSDSVITFLSFIKKKIHEIGHEDIISFNNAYIIRNHLSQSYQNQSISSIKLFFKVVMRNDLLAGNIARPFQEKRLPEVFGLQEVERILLAIHNRKHRTMLALIYACGLRRNELLNIRITDINSVRKVLMIREGKGNKDRIVPLPESMIVMLREYYKEYRPKFWLFEGIKPGERYSASSLREAFMKGLKDAGIGRALTLHSLRHSYATHLLENGTDLRMIQVLLGHRSSRTTEIYTHVASQNIERVRSPFEKLNLK